MTNAASSRFARSDPFLTGRLEMNQALVRFGNRIYAPADIVSFRVESSEKSGLLGNICAFALFILLAGLILEAVVGHVFTTRSLIGAVALGAVALASLQDTWFERGNGFYRLFVTLRDEPGDVMVFATSERQDVVQAAGRLAEVLDGLERHRDARSVRASVHDLAERGLCDPGQQGRDDQRL